jgi:hypothetical protein
MLGFFFIDNMISREVPNKKDTVNMDNGRVNRYIMTMTLAEFFVIVQTCVFSSLATNSLFNIHAYVRICCIFWNVDYFC